MIIASPHVPNKGAPLPISRAAYDDQECLLYQRQHNTSTIKTRRRLLIYLYLFTSFSRDTRLSPCQCTHRWKNVRKTERSIRGIPKRGAKTQGLCALVKRRTKETKRKEKTREVADWTGHGVTLDENSTRFRGVSFST